MIEIGTTAQWRGQAYELIAIRPDTRLFHYLRGQKIIVSIEYIRQFA